MKDTVLVIGAGPAGTVAASYLIKQGFQVKVLEKETFPRFVIGESLLPQCMDSLEEAGLLEHIIDSNFQKKAGATFRKDDKAFTFTFSEQHSKSWDWTWQVKRSEFDKALVDAAQKNGVSFSFNCEVVDVKLNEGNQVTTYLDENGAKQNITSNYIIDASGYGRVLPRLFKLDKPSTQTPRGSVFAHIKETRRNDLEAKNIIIYSFNNNKSWLWAIPFLDNNTSIGVVASNEDIEKLSANGGQKFKELVKNAPEFKGRFQDVAYDFEPKSILGFSIGIEKMYGPGYVLCGNSTEFLDPIFSSGVTLAAASGLLSAKLVAKEIENKAVNWQVEYEDKMNHAIDVFRSYVNAWYNGDLPTIFFNDYINQDMKKQICSVLAGHVWDQTNPFVKKHKTLLGTLTKVIEIEKKRKSNKQNPSNNMKTDLSAIEAKSIAQEISFAPVVFQTVHCLLKFGILNELQNNKAGLSIDELHKKTGISKYGIGVLLEMAYTANIVGRTEDEIYTIRKIGHFLLNDSMTAANFDFIQDVCYQGLFYLDKAIETGKPEGLKVFGEWNTIYEALSVLPKKAKDSWFKFDHFYSDGSFAEALDIVFASKPKHILDVGGNTGKWTMKCCEYNGDVRVSILDLPGQLKMAEANLVERGFQDRVSLVPTNVLAPELLFPSADVIWMSQFLDCFSSDEIVSILKHAAKNMDANSSLFIMETFWDNQKYDVASFSLAATSLYFTAMANGNSKMYGLKEFTRLVEKAGLKIVKSHALVGISHTILQCQKG